MNQKGEITLLSVLSIFIISTLILLCSLELKKSFHLLKQRTNLFLCLKEVKGELNIFLKFMGKTNWGIKNIDKAGTIMMFVPGLQGAAASAKKAKKILQFSQQARLISFVKTLTTLKSKGCSLDPLMGITPFEIGPQLLIRDAFGAAKLREKKWSYQYLKNPYNITLNIDASRIESTHPEIRYYTEERWGKLSSLLSSL